MAANARGRRISDDVRARIAIGLLTAGAVKVNPTDPKSVNDWANATDAACTALFPTASMPEVSVGFGRVSPHLE
jgi:hypothetical protein